jgi:hypothetical protein
MDSGEFSYEDVSVRTNRKVWFFIIAIPLALGLALAILYFIYQQIAPASATSKERFPAPELNTRIDRANEWPQHAEAAPVPGLDKAIAQVLARVNDAYEPPSGRRP